jgi:hypothetical protein
MTAAPLPEPTARDAGRPTTAGEVDSAQLRRLRWAVRAVLTLGVAASIAANVLHARPHLISQTIAAWPPPALLLTVELISRVPSHHRSLAILRLIATSAIAGIAAWVSYRHMGGVAARYGQAGTTAYLLPLSVDGLVVVVSISLIEIAGRIRAAEPAVRRDRSVQGAVPALAPQGATDAGRLTTAPNVPAAGGPDDVCGQRRSTVPEGPIRQPTRDDDSGEVRRDRRPADRAEPNPPQPTDAPMVDGDRSGRDTGFPRPSGHVRYRDAPGCLRSR